MANNKVVLSNGTTLIDLSTDTVTSASHIVRGYVGHLATGAVVTGTGGGSDYYMWQDSDGYLHYSNSALGASGYVITASTEYQEVAETWETLYEDTLYADSYYERQNAMGVTIYELGWSYSAASGLSLVEGDTYRLTVGSDVYRLTAWTDSTYMNSVAIGSDVIGWDGVSSLSCPHEAYMGYREGTQYLGMYSTTNTANGTFKLEHLIT